MEVTHPRGPRSLKPKCSQCSLFQLNCTVTYMNLASFLHKAAPFLQRVPWNASHALLSALTRTLLLSESILFCLTFWYLVFLSCPKSSAPTALEREILYKSSRVHNQLQCNPSHSAPLMFPKPEPHRPPKGWEDHSISRPIQPVVSLLNNKEGIYGVGFK